MLLLLAVWKITLTDKCGLNDHRDEVLLTLSYAEAISFFLSTCLYNACIFIQGYDYCFEELFPIVI